jgi:hypothetical protein
MQALPFNSRTGRTQPWWYLSILQGSNKPGCPEVQTLWVVGWTGSTLRIYRDESTLWMYRDESILVGLDSSWSNRFRITRRWSSDRLYI